MTQQGQWQLTGSAAERYERYVVPYQFDSWAQELVEHMDIQPRERVLDVACGTGIVARYALQKVGVSGSVTGLDLNPGMLAVAASLSFSTDASNISWVECSALEMQLDDDSFDVVLCQQGFQFFPDKLAALKEMRRVLVSDGRLAISVWRGPSPYNIALANGVERHLGPEAGQQQRSSRTVPSADEIEKIIAEAGFRATQVTPSIRTRRLPLPEEYLPLHLASMPIASRVAAMDEEARNALIKDIADELQPYVEDRELVIQDQINVGTAVK